MPAPNREPRGYLPRLAPEYYRDRAVVLWTHTIAQRGTGWLTSEFHLHFRELMLHAAARENLLCPVYVLMPDHFHFIWMGTSDASDQRVGIAFLRSQLKSRLAPLRFQHQPHDSVLDESRRRKNAFARVCHYLAENPVRAQLAASATDWPYIGCIVPGYPSLQPMTPDFWEKFWPIYNAATERGQIGKIASQTSLLTSAATNAKTKAGEQPTYEG